MAGHEPRCYLIYDDRACGDCGAEGPPDRALCLTTSYTDVEAREDAEDDHGAVACYSYRVKGLELVEERWEWDWYPERGFNDGQS